MSFFVEPGTKTRLGQINIGSAEASMCPVADPNRKQAIIAIVAAILAARKLSTVPPNSPAYVAAIADAVADARRIVDRVEKSFQP
jgi:hypothetical protein